jgi:chromosomal replication initiation ATPase DnaA
MNTVEKVCVAVADCFDLEYEQLLASNKYIEVVTARRFVYYILNKKYNYSVESLCEEFEKTDASINFGVNHINKWLDYSKEAKKDYLYIISKLDNYES